MFGWTAQEKERLFDDLAQIKAQTRAAREELNLTEQVVTLKRQITDLEIKKSKVEEDNARERRELTHMIGLEKRRQETELAQGKKDAELTVREANLSADRTRFDEQMKFQMERFNKEVDYLHGMVGQMLERLPTVTVDRTIGPAPTKPHFGSLLGDEWRRSDLRSKLPDAVVVLAGVARRKP